MYLPPRAEVLFGDIFEAPYLFDAHLRADARPLVHGVFPQKAPLEGEFYADPQPKLPLDKSTNVAAHGLSGRPNPATSGRALLVTEDCAIQTILGLREDRSGPSGRFLFAIIQSESNEEVERLQVPENVPFGRFPLPSQELIGGEAGVAELRRVFMVDARVVDPNHRIASLDDDARRMLDQRWAAHIIRRGPEVGLKEAEKLAAVLGGDSPNPQQQELARHLGALFEAGWEVDGELLTVIDEIFRAGTAPFPALDRVPTGLREVAALATRVADLLDAER